MGGAPIFRRARRTAEGRLASLFVADCRRDPASMELTRKERGDAGHDRAFEGAMCTDAIGRAAVTRRTHARFCYHRFLTSAITAINVEPVLLTCMVLSAATGAWVGTGIVAI
jgi:hypothetical protein